MPGCIVRSMNVPTAIPASHEERYNFEARAEAAWKHYQATGESVSTAEVLAKLQANLDAKRKLLVTRAPQLG
jgi:predicted transcriptional regulator